MISKFARHGVTLVEVIFAIGVVLIGLVGLLSILPLAGRRSQESVSLATAASVGNSVMNELLSRRLITGHGQMRLRVPPSTPVSYNASLKTWTPASVSTGFCIDPLYVATQGTLADAANRYNETLFPYYDVNCDPLLNPSDSASGDWPEPQARLQRLGLQFAVGSLAASTEQSRFLVENDDDIVVDRPKDRSDDARLPGLTAVSNLIYGRRVPTGEFTWIATVSPLADNRHASVSVVVLRKRDGAQDFPTTTETEPLKNGNSERLAYVVAASGFSGGAGGSVVLAASDKTSSVLAANDWIMLSRPITGSQPVHRWYRVVSVESKASVVQTDGNSSTADTKLQGRLPDYSATPPRVVWGRRVQLDGPDWNFGFSTSATEDFSQVTVATLMKDVVSVTERTIPLSEL